MNLHIKDEYLGSLEANFVMLIHHLFVRMEKQWVRTSPNGFFPFDWRKYLLKYVCSLLPANRLVAPPPIPLQKEQLVEDIERGSVSEDVQMSEPVRRQLNDYMAGPDPQRARLLSQRGKYSRPFDIYLYLLFIYLLCSSIDMY